MKYALLAGLASANVSIHTGNWAREISWVLKDLSGNVLCKYDLSRGTPNWSSIEMPSCPTPMPKRWVLECHDSYHDGWNGGYLSINGAHYCGTEHFDGHMYTVSPPEEFPKHPWMRAGE